MRFKTLLTLFMLLLPGFVHAACADLAYRQFDFWQGEWNVATADGKLVGRDRIEKDYGGCVLQEHWTSVDGGTGGSYSIYDASRKLWHQTWVDSTGTLLVLEGKLKDGHMELSGDETLPSGKHALNRMSWTPTGDKLRQLWEVSQDGGKTWKTVFDVYYAKAN